MTQEQSKKNLNTQDNQVDDDDDEYNDYPTGCVDDESEYFYNFGDQWSDPNGCNRKTCQSNGTIKEEKCPELEVPEGCQVVCGLNVMDLDFPFCCDRVVCPGDPEFNTEEQDNNYFCEDKYCIREVGEQWSDRGVCNLKTCKKYYKIDTQTCPEVSVPEGCKLSEDDLSQKFPFCCPKVVCPWDKSITDSSSSSVEENQHAVKKEETISATTEKNNSNQTSTALATSKGIRVEPNVLEDNQQIAQRAENTTENDNRNHMKTTITTNEGTESSRITENYEENVLRDTTKLRNLQVVKNKNNNNKSNTKKEKEKDSTQKEIVMKNAKKGSKMKAKNKRQRQR